MPAISKGDGRCQQHLCLRQQVPLTKRKKCRARLSMFMSFNIVHHGRPMVTHYDCRNHARKPPGYGILHHDFWSVMTSNELPICKGVQRHTYPDARCEDLSATHNTNIASAGKT